MPAAEHAHLDLTRALSAWRPEPVVVVLVCAVGAAYWLGLRRLGGRWPVSRTVSFFAGLGCVLLVTVTWVGVYAGTLFWVRALQNLVLLMVAPLLLALGAPLTLLRDLLPEPTRARGSRLLHSAALRALTFPPLIAVLLVAPLYLVYLTPLNEAAQRHGPVAFAAGLGLVAAGFGYFWTRLRIDPTPRSDPHLVTVAMSIAEVVLDGALGLRLWLGPTVATGYYAGLRSWGPDLRLDQTIGAGVLWFGGDLAGLVFLAAVARRMVHDEEEQAQHIDAVLDAASPPAAGPEAAPEQAESLWWETDPQIAHRFRRPESS